MGNERAKENRGGEEEGKDREKKIDKDEEMADASSKKRAVVEL